MSDEPSRKTREPDGARAERTSGVPYRRRSVLKFAGALAGVGLGGRAFAGETTASAPSVAQQDTTPGESTQQGPASLPCNEWVEGTLPNDPPGSRQEFVDSYRFSADAGTVLSVEMETVRGDGVPSLQLYTIEGGLLGEDENSDGGPTARTEPVALPEREGFVVFARANLPPAGTLDYRIRLNCVEEYDPEPIECGRSVRGALTTDDRTGFRGVEYFYETYALSVEETQQVTASLSAVADANTDEKESESASWDGVAGMPYLYLVEPDGVVIERSDGGGSEPAAFDRTLRKPGEYVLVVTSSAPSSTFAYELTVECGPIEATPFECGETILGALTTDDDRGFRPPTYPFPEPDYYFDAYRFEGTEGEYVALDVSGRGTSFVDPGYLYLLDPDGTVVAGEDSPGTANPTVDRRLPADGAYTVVVTSRGLGWTFEYELATDCRVNAAAIGPTEEIACGDWVTGAVTTESATDLRGPDYYHDAFRFDGVAGESLDVTLSSVGNDPYLYLLDPDDGIVTTAAGTDEALLRADDLDTSGEYTVVVTSATPSTTFEYRLSVACDTVYYQVDLVAGEPEQRLGEHPEDFYSRQRRLLRYLHGGSETPVARQGTPPSLDPEIAHCVRSRPMTVDGTVATATFTVEKGCEQVLSLVSYSKPTAGWDPEDADEQRLFDSVTRRFGPGTHTLRVDLPASR